MAELRTLLRGGGKGSFGWGAWGQNTDVISYPLSSNQKNRFPFSDLPQKSIPFLKPLKFMYVSNT